MRKCVGILVLVALLAGLVAVVVGCGAQEGVITTPQGELQYKAGKITLRAAEGGKETTWAVTQASANAIGVPVPDSAKVEQGSVAVVKQTNGKEKWTGATFWDDETVDQVIAFYRSELSSMDGFVDTSTNLDGQNVGLFTVKSGSDVKSVIVTAGQSGDPGKTKIVIANMVKS